VFVVPPGSQIGPITAAQRQAVIANSLVAGVYEKTVDRESAYEKLKGRAETAPDAPQPKTAGAGKGAAEASEGSSMLNDLLFGSTGPRGGKRDGLVQTMAKSAVRTMGTSVGKEILRGVLGGIFGAKKR
jgi:hypothetical protein